MQEWPDDHLDDLFRKSAEEFDVPFDLAHWTDMSNRLDEHDRQAFYDRWRVWGGAVALTGLLLITLWWAWKVTTVAANPIVKRNTNQPVVVRTNANDSPEGEHSRVVSAPATSAAKPNSIAHHPTDSRPTPGVVKQPVATPDWAVRSREIAGQWRRRAATGTPVKTELRHSGVVVERADDENELVTTLNRSGSPARKRIAEKPRRAEGVASRGKAGQPVPIGVVAETSTSTAKTTANGHRSDHSPEPISSTNAPNNRSGGFSDQLQPAQPAMPTDNLSTDVMVLTGEVPGLERLLLGAATPVFPRTAVKTGPLSGFLEPEAADNEQPMKRVVTPRQRFSIMAVVSPDLSSIGLRDFTRPGTNAGLMIQYRLSNRFSLQTGALISTKKYQTTSEYYVWPAAWSRDIWPSNISGTCTMYDIPLNLRFDWLLRPMGNGMPPARWFASAGLTSYFIKRETYTYDYENPNDPRIMYRGWDNQKAGAPGGKFGFSNLNVSVGYERPMGRHLSWQVEPFMKIPLQQVGNFKVRLLSTGAFVGLKYSL